MATISTKYHLFVSVDLAKKFECIEQPTILKCVELVDSAYYSNFKHYISDTFAATLGYKQDYLHSVAITRNKNRVIIKLLNKTLYQ